MADHSRGFTIVRTVNATPEQVWAAWTDPDLAARWWHPSNTTTPRDSVAIDARVGGRYTYTMINDTTGQHVVTSGVYREVVPFERLVFTWGDPAVDPDDCPVVTLLLEADGAGTRLTFELRGVPGKPGDHYFYDGWVQALDSLDHFVERAG